MRPSTTAQGAPAPVPEAAKRIPALQKQYAGRRFRDGGITWQISGIRLDGKTQEPMAHYFDTKKFSKSPAAKDQERTPLAELEEHADWVRPGAAPKAAEPSRLNLRRAIQPGRWVYVKNHQMNFNGKNQALVTPDAPLFWIAKVTRIQGKEATLEWYREESQNRYVRKEGEGGSWDEDVRSCSLLHPSPTVAADGSVSLSQEMWEELHVPSYRRATGKSQPRQG